MCSGRLRRVSRLPFLTVFMSLVVASLTCILLMGAGLRAAAQTPDPTDELAPDYAIRSIYPQYSETTIIVLFDVENNGGAAEIPTTARLVVTGGGEIPGTELPIPPLDRGDRFSVRLEFQSYLFQDRAGLPLSVTAVVGIGDIEALDSERIQDNSARISVLIPASVAPPISGIGDLTAQTAPDPEMILGIRFDPETRITIAGIVAVVGIVLLLLWVITVILRLLFTRQPKFTTWQPPYAQASYLDPNSLPGRRSLWQPHAQGDTLPVPCAPGTYAARKRLIGVDGAKLKGWRVVGVRLNQYDMYGRVSRSQIIGANGAVRRLNRVARRSAKTDLRHAERRTRSVASSLAKSFTRKVSKRNALLPLALDVRFDGRHGDVRIAFELHQCVGDGYQRIDQWEPEMLVTSGGMIHENLTYSLFGQRQNERSRAFRRRLRDDISKTLAQALAADALPQLIATQSPPVSDATPTTRRGRRNASKELPPTPPVSAPIVPTVEIGTQPIDALDTAQVKTVTNDQPPTTPP